jgi:LytT family two-component system sensor histidine kinase NatK
VNILQNISYWALIAIIGFIHFYFLFDNIMGPLLSVIIIFLLLLKKIHLPIFVLGRKENAAIFVLQGMILILSFGVQNNLYEIFALCSFIGIEIVRIVGAKKIYLDKQALEQMEKEREQFNDMFRVVRSERHDFLKHVSTLHYMLEHDEFTEAQNYLNELVDGYKETNLSIKGERGVVAGILHQMYGRAKSLNIDVIYDLDLPLSSLPLSNKEIVTFIGNLLSNSIEACEEWQNKYGKQAMLTLQFYKLSGLFILICKNNTVNIPNDTLDQLFVTYGNTTKGAGHEGLGTKLIQDIVKNHDDFLDFIHKDETFTVKIKIPAIQ